MIERILIAGSGGQGIIISGKILAGAGVQEFEHVTFFPCYGAEVRGGAEDAGRLLRAQRGAVVGALRIVENEHGEIVVIPPHRGRRRNLKKENENK